MSDSSGDVEKVIAVVGSLNADLLVNIDKFPVEGETILGKSLTQFAGGKGLNQAIAASRAGGNVALIGAVGHDTFGSTLKSVITDEGVTDHVTVIDGQSSGAAIIEVENSGSNRIIVIDGANSCLDPDTVEQSLRALHATMPLGVVLVQCEIPLSCIERALKVGRELKAITILNPAPIRDFAPEIFKVTDYLIPNEHEARTLAGLADAPLKSMLDCVEAAQAMIDLGSKNVIITRGEKGAVWANALGSGQAAAFRVVPVDTVAAGDAFCGVFASALNDGKSFAEALRWASAAGALAATQPGATTSLPNRAEIEHMLSEGS